MNVFWLVILCCVFVGIFGAQSFWPKRKQVHVFSQRQLHNILLCLTNFVLLKLIVPFSVISVAHFAEQGGYGFFHFIALPVWLEMVIVILILDCMIYWQHVAMHRIAFLWRFHKVHHADTEMDVTTAVRFHFVELLFSFGVRAIAVILLGASVTSVIVFELILLVFPVFNHSNVFLSARIDATLKKWIVTPDMHRVHHSIYLEEQNSNFGFFLSCWDVWFASYRAQAKDSDTSMRLGLTQIREKPLKVHDLIMLPFRP